MTNQSQTKRQNGGFAFKGVIVCAQMSAEEAYRSWHEGCSKKNPYIKRDFVVRALGFIDYGDYLRSDKWRAIRVLALRKNGGRCIRCSQSATQVHHSRYDRKAMTGQSLKYLWPVCRICHEEAELLVRVKKNLYEANAFLGALSKSQQKYWAKAGRHVRLWKDRRFGFSDDPMGSPDDGIKKRHFK